MVRKNNAGTKAAAPEATAVADPVETPPVTVVDEVQPEAEAPEAEATEVSVTHRAFSLVNGDATEVTSVGDWQNSATEGRFAVEADSFEMTEAEGLGADQCSTFVGKAEVDEYRKAFKLDAAIDKVAQVWSQAEADTGVMAAKRLLPEMGVGDAKYPHVLRTEDGMPILLKSSKVAVGLGKVTGQDKVGVLIRCLSTGKVMRVWTSDVHQTCRTKEAKRDFDKGRKAKKAKPTKAVKAKKADAPEAEAPEAPAADAS